MKAGQAGLKQTNTSQSFGRRGTFRPGTCLLEKINASQLGGELLRPKKKTGSLDFCASQPVVSSDVAIPQPLDNYYM